MREYGYLFLLVASNEKRGLKLLNGCQKALTTGDRALVAHRYSTRMTAEAYEVALSDDEFDARNDFGCFVLDWQTKDIRFALGVEVDRWLDGGLNVLCLASAAAIEAARMRYRHHVRVVFAPGVSANPGWLDRLIKDRRVRFRQLGLGFEESPGVEEGVDGLQLDAQLDLAVEQLISWVQLKTPPAMAVA